jgi:methionine salvage enolase-phosphatase E1
MDLRKVSKDQLLAEIQRREAEEQRSAAPRPVANPNFDDLRETVIRGVEETVESGYQDEDFKHYVYEAAVQAVYGKSFWEWKRKKGI